MLWELLQQTRIHQANWTSQDAKLSAKEAQNDARNIQNHVRELEQQVERLTLAAMAMAEILRDRLAVSEGEIEAKIREIDLRDGQLDGKASIQPRECSRCQRPNGPRRSACLYCGEALTGESFLFKRQSGTEG